MEVSYGRSLLLMSRAALNILLLTAFLCSGAASAELSDSEIRDVLIQRSIAEYPDKCPCPYNLDARGRRCGARSAYTKPGGAAPLCYPSDVTDEMVGRYRKLNH